MPVAAELTRYLFEHARDIVLVICPASGSILGANRAAELAYGYSRDELLSMKIFALRVTPTVEVARQMQVANSEGILFEALHRRRDGSTFPVEVSSLGHERDGQRLLFSIVRDISERKQFELERERLLAAAQRALALRDDFLMIASHELRAPVTNFILELEHVSRQFGRAASAEQLAAGVQRSVREARRLASLIDTLLDAQVARGEIALHLETFDLRDLAAEAIERMRSHADHTGSRLDANLSPVTGRWDRLRVDQVLTNLLLNAIKYGRGRPISIAVRAEDARAVLEVVDQGIGVSSADVQRIFDKFERAVPAHYGGLGLGLYITKQLVEAHRGEIAIDSVPNVGTRIRVALPRQP